MCDTPGADDALIIAAQQRRARRRLRDAQAEIERLRLRVEGLERSWSRRLSAPARFVLRRGRTLLKPRHVPGPSAVEAVASRGIALVIDAEWPEPDRDSGSIDIVNLVQALDRLGFSVTLAATERHCGEQPARTRLQARGMRCLSERDAPSVKAWIGRHGALVDLCVLCRVFSGGALLELVERECRSACLVFNPIDLNFVREERRAALTGDAALRAAGPALRAREQHLVRRSDATIVVSRWEQDLLNRDMPDCRVARLPLARELVPPRAGFAERRGIGFVGGFAHAPNVDAMRWFLVAIWPAIHAALPDCAMSIVGADAPADLLGGVDGPVRLLGQLPVIDDWLEGLRLTVAPLRFGAGAKGKVATSLSAGLPCVATSVAVEGMGLGAAHGAMVADTPAGFAEAVIGLYRDEARWEAASAGAIAFAREHLSLAAWQTRLDGLLVGLGL